RQLQLDRRAVQRFRDHAAPGWRGRSEGDDLVAGVEGRLGEAPERAADVVVHACPLVREGRDVEGNPHELGVNDRKWAPSRRRSPGPGTAVRATVNRTVHTPCLGTSGTLIVVIPVTGTRARPMGAPCSVAMTDCGVLNRLSSPWSRTASAPPV